MTGTTRRPLVVCVWELTLACNARCIHCGSDAGKPRARELDTDEALALVGELSTLGCQSITFSGGEPLLRSDWPVLAAAIRASGIRLEMITNGLLAAEQADIIASSGFWAITVSVDGPEAVHDHLRGGEGCLAETLRGVKALRERGIRIGAVTQINQRNLDRLGDTLDVLVQHGFSGWQLQLTLPHGRARHRVQDDFCLRPDQLPALEHTLVALQTRAPFFVQAADSIGYMSRHEPRLRTGRSLWERCWRGCAAGLEVVGITSDGTVRGCLSLPTGVADEGNLRTRSLVDLWDAPRAFSYNRAFTPETLGPGCHACAFGELCRGGCQSLAWATTGRFHENAHCILAAEGRTGLRT
jgi:radical SAM protein with 4Fe4S-binding SPASM domain